MPVPAPGTYDAASQQTLLAVKAKTDIIGASVSLESGGNITAIKTKTDELPPYTGYIIGIGRISPTDGSFAVVSGTEVSYQFSVGAALYDLFILVSMAGLGVGGTTRYLGVGIQGHPARKYVTVPVTVPVIGMQVFINLYPVGQNLEIVAFQDSGAVVTCNFMYFGKRYT